MFQAKVLISTARKALWTFFIARKINSFHFRPQYNVIHYFPLQKLSQRHVGGRFIIQLSIAVISLSIENLDVCVQSIQITNYCQSA